MEINEHGIIISAKIDTGADSTSLNAEELEIFKREGSKWARFSVSGHSGKGMSIIIRPG